MGAPADSSRRRQHDGRARLERAILHLHLHGSSSQRRHLAHGPRRAGSGRTRHFCDVKVPGGNADETEDERRRVVADADQPSRHGGPQTSAAAWTPEPRQPASRRRRAAEQSWCAGATRNARLRERARQRTAASAVAERRGCTSTRRRRSIAKGWGTGRGGAGAEKKGGGGEVAGSGWEVLASGCVRRAAFHLSKLSIPNSRAYQYRRP